MFAAFDVPISWGELLKRTLKDAKQDDVLGLAAQLAYYFFLALFPTVLFLLAIASFFPLTNVLDDAIRSLRPIAPGDVLSFFDEQLRRISNRDSGGILTVGILGALWSSSAGLVAIIGSLNKAYDIEEGRPFWKVRLAAIGLTIALAVFVITSFTLIVAGPRVAEYLAGTFGFGPVFEWGWKILQWPLAFLMVTFAVGLVYYFAPDAEQDWVWITPGAVLGTLLWAAASLSFKFYLTRFADYNATYGAVGGVIVLLLWFYMSGLAILIGAELNAEIERASPHGKAPGEKVPGEKKKIGPRAARAYKEKIERHAPHPVPALAFHDARAADRGSRDAAPTAAGIQDPPGHAPGASPETPARPPGLLAPAALLAAGASVALIVRKRVGRRRSPAVTPDGAMRARRPRFMAAIGTGIAIVNAINRARAARRGTPTHVSSGQ